MIRIGIDTGGTFTDAVIIEMGEGTPKVLAKAKALTTKSNLMRGILSAMDALPRDLLMSAEEAAISTTLATNACVEGKGGRAKLIIVGTTDEVLRRVDAQNKFGISYSDVLTTPFVGTYDGVDVTVPDWDALYEANKAFFHAADSFGIASLYALNNGAEVEKSGAAWLRQKFGKLVVEAITVAAEPDVIARGATALLNARLVPVIGEFLDAITASFAARDLNIPIKIIRSDGTLMSEELARTRPVETILSGPAASVIGAQELAGSPECLIVDIGGTTSDISIVHGGRPNRTDGIFIGGWKTQVPGVFIDTIALGGDTVVRFTKNCRLELGTRKVTPLCIAAQRWPEVKRKLAYYYKMSAADYNSRYELFYLMTNPGDLSRYSEAERRFLELLREGPIAHFDERIGEIFGLKIDRLETAGIVMRCGMTPTDAMHLKGEFDEFDTEASLLGARCILKSYRGLPASKDDEEVAKLADEIYDLAKFRLYNQIISAFIQDTYRPGKPSALDEQMKSIVTYTWEHRHDAPGESFAVSFGGSAKLVGVGAPTHVFLDEVGEALGMSYVVPEDAGVANAVGAAASRVMVEQRVVINPLRGPDGVVQCYQVRGSDSLQSYETIEEAVEAGRMQVRLQAEAEARRRGATGELHCDVESHRNVYGAAGTMELVREWVITARIE